MTGVGPKITAATKMWFGKAPTAGLPFVAAPPWRGRNRRLSAFRPRPIYFGENYQDFVEMSAGDFMFVPPFLPHLEANMSTTEELWWLACRTPENIVVNLPDIDDALLNGYRRA